MALIKEIVEIPARKEERIRRLKCDSCEKESISGQGWSNTIYEVEEVTIEYRSGSSYPECSWIRNITVDLCPDCFKNKFITWIKSQNIGYREEEKD